VIVLLAGSAESVRTEVIIGILVGVMLLNFLAMLYARRILAGAGIIVLQILGGVLGMLQAGLAVQIILQGLQDLKLISL
jgi:multiple antibiotic resistance protein